MLKELNRIAAGLLGLHGYPVEPWPAPAKDVGSRQRATTAPRRTPPAVTRTSPRRRRVRLAPGAWR